MRLIDADNVLHYMTDEQKKRMGMMSVKGVIDKQPTVFNCNMRKELIDSIEKELERYNASSALRVCILRKIGKYFGR